MDTRIIVDSQLSLNEALKQNPQIECPPEVIATQALLNVTYFSFDGKLHQGQIVIHQELTQDVQDLFELLRNIKFPIASVIPVADPSFHWDDQISVKANNSSGFNYRNIYKTDRLSNHSFGRAIDINPKLNPYFRDDWVSPEGATYNPNEPGTIVANDQIVKFFKDRGWEWGGDWEDRKDYQHFQKLE